MCITSFRLYCGYKQVGKHKDVNMKLPLTITTAFLSILSFGQEIDSTVFYYQNGQIQFKYMVVNGNKNGPFNGYYENGELWSSGNYKKGILDGEFYTFTLEGGSLVCLRLNNGREECFG